ncbi:MAG: hypothetical protein KY467_01225 [Gemmatimonadetes bacterium]|nr:hypothetical protein [Gemmatimonadota bacterium]
MSRAAAGAWTAASEGINNVGGALLRIMQQEREAKEREQARLDQKEYQTGMLGLQRDQLSQAAREAAENRRLAGAQTGISITERPDTEAMSRNLSDAAAGLEGALERPSNIGGYLKNIAAQALRPPTRTEYAYDVERDPATPARREGFAHQTREREGTERFTAGENSLDRRNKVDLTHIGGRYSVQAAGVGRSGGGGPSAADQRATRERAEAEAGYIATRAVAHHGGVDKALAAARAEPPGDPMRDLVIQQLQRLGQEEGRKALLNPDPFREWGKQRGLFP